VTLLDASESPGGLSSAFATPGGQLVEPGVKGFWFQVRLRRAVCAACAVGPTPVWWGMQAWCSQTQSRARAVFVFLSTFAAALKRMLAPPTHAPTPMHARPAHDSTPTSRRWCGSWACQTPSRPSRAAAFTRRAACRRVTPGRSTAGVLCFGAQQHV
jgi:hypothetical protein